MPYRSSPTRFGTITTGLLAFTLAAGGCMSNPFAKSPLDTHTVASNDRLRSINTLILDQRASDENTQAQSTSETLEQARERFKGVERVNLNLDNARVAALSNNLGLSATLISPIIAAERVSEEEGRFEAIFTLSASVADNDNATASTLSSGESTSRSITPGITVPLRTGGSLSVTLPISRFESDNSFSFLNPSYSSDLHLSLSHNLLRGAGRRAATHSIRIAEYDRQISESQTKLEVIRTLAEVDRAYWRLYASTRALEVVEQQHAVAIAQLERAERKERAGTGTQVDIVRAQSGVADRVEQIIRAQNDVQLQERAIKVLLNLPGLDANSPTHFELTSPPDPVEYTFDAANLTQAAISNRMELLELELQLARDAASIAFAENQKLPLVALAYTYRVNGLGNSIDNSLDTLSRNNFETWTLGLNAEIPIGNTQREASLAQSILSRLQRLATRDAREQSITREVYDAIDQLSSTWNRILATQEAVSLSARVLEAEQRQFDAGRSTTTDVLIADTNLADARLTEIRAIVEYQVAQIDLAFATGTLLGQSKVDWAPSDPRTIQPIDGEPDAEARAKEGVIPYRPGSGIVVSP
ncbi:MAG: TolC family protein [Phycisphaerales bacterium]|nr:TolC family protein [Phycisphaerales bacterium]